MTQKKDSPTRREFVRQSAVLAGGALFSTRLAANNNASSIRVIDQQIWHVNESFNGDYKSVPKDLGFRLHPGLPSLPSALPVPFEWGEENLYGRTAGHFITDNVYLEPGKPWVLQLLIST